MNFSSFTYLCKQGWRSMLKNRLMTLASIGVLTACLVITGIAAVLSADVNSFVDYLGSRNNVEIYINKDATQEQIDALGEKLKGMENISDCTFISKTEAMNELMARMESYADLLESYTTDEASNPLNASYRVTIANIEQLASTVEKIRQIGEPIYTIESPSNLVNILVSLQHGAYIAGISMVVILGFVSIVVISNTIRLTVFARRKEINIMKFVGATNGFIRMPFFVEGMTVGAIAGVLATLIVLGLNAGVCVFLGQSSMLLVTEISQNLYTVAQIWLPLLGAFLLFGIFIGGVGCVTSIRKHLKV